MGVLVSASVRNLAGTAAAVAAAVLLAGCSGDGRADATRTTVAPGTAAPVARRVSLSLTGMT